MNYFNGFDIDYLDTKVEIWHLSTIHISLRKYLELTKNEYNEYIRLEDINDL